jgi:hypothetical protein
MCYLTCCKTSLHGADGFIFPPKQVVLRIFIAHKNPSLSAGFEPANITPNTKHDKYRTTENDNAATYKLAWSLIATTTTIRNFKYSSAVTYKTLSVSHKVVEIIFLPQEKIVQTPGVSSRPRISRDRHQRNIFTRSNTSIAIEKLMINGLTHNIYLIMTMHFEK